MKILPKFLLAALAVTACAESRAAPGADEAADPSVIEIMVTGYTFDAPDEVPAGWLTYRLNNESGHEIHEVSIARLPEGRTFEEYMEEIIPPWVEVWEGIDSGELDRAGVGALAGELLPEWNRDISYAGARGLVSAGRSTSSSYYLEPGSYVIACWVKTPSGHIHIPLGMARPLTVTGEASDHTPPDPDLEISVVGTQIVVDGELHPGDRTVRFRVADADAPANVHLIRMDPDTDPEAVVGWMDWYAVGGLQAPTPADFLGGVSAYGSGLHEGRAYFGVENVEPGRYAWIVEGPVGERVGLWKVFQVD